MLKNLYSIIFILVFAPLSVSAQNTPSVYGETVHFVLQREDTKYYLVKEFESLDYEVLANELKTNRQRSSYAEESIEKADQEIIKKQFSSGANDFGKVKIPKPIADMGFTKEKLVNYRKNGLKEYFSFNNYSYLYSINPITFLVIKE
tara:strand:- start:1707 stop:2147 length:441 start_codon:yes stop_codon:yes gene_type:complete